MKKQLLLLMMMLLPIAAMSENVSKEIYVYLNSYSCYSGMNSYENAGITIHNQSSVNILITGIMAYKAEGGEVFYINTDTQPLQFQSSLSHTIKYSGLNFLEMGGWYVHISYLNQEDQQYYNKIVYKKPNYFGTNMLLEDVDEDNPDPGNSIIEDVLIDGLCFDLDLTNKEAKLRSSSKVSYSGNIVIPVSVNYQGEDYIVTSIKTGTFSNNWNVTSVSIPSSVKNIESSAFYVCLKMTQLSIAEGLEEIGDDAFFNCNGLSIVTLPNSVKTIKRGAFSSCYGLSSVILGSGVSDIGYYAFQNCKNLSDFYCYAYSVPSATLSFDSSVKNATLHVPASSLSRYKWDWNWDDFKNIIAITENDPKPTGVETVIANTFEVNKIFTLDGRSIYQMQKGLNIVILDDGTVKKVIMK